MSLNILFQFMYEYSSSEQATSLNDALSVERLSWIYMPTLAFMMLDC